MKTKVKQLKPEPVFTQHTVAINFLSHILSPLEMAAYRGSFKPFEYDFDGVTIYISNSACSQLLQSTKNKIQMFTKVLSDQEYYKKMPLRLRETLEDPRIILSLPPLLRNKLCRIECYTMGIIARYGRNYISTQKGLGAEAIKTLDTLFKKHKCSQLF